MSRTIIVASNAAHLSDRGELHSRDYRRFSPVQQRRLHSNSQRASSGRADAGFGNRELITERIRVGRGPALGEVGKVTIFGRKPTRPALNFPRLTKAAGSLNPIPHSALTVRQDTLRNGANRFHLSCVAPAFHEQREPQEPLEMSKKTPEKSQMQSELVFASDVMRERIAPPGSAPSVAARIAAASRTLKWKYSRVFSVWYADERVSLKPRELRQIEELTGVTYGKQEVNEIDHLVSRASALLESQDSDFHSAFAAAVRAFASALDRSRTEG